MADLRKLIQKLADTGDEIYSVTGVVQYPISLGGYKAEKNTDPTRRTVNVLPNNGSPLITNVRLQADLFNDTGVVLVPSEGSTVVVSFLDKETAFISMCTDIEEYYCNVTVPSPIPTENKYYSFRMIPKGRSKAEGEENGGLTANIGDYSLTIDETKGIVVGDLKTNKTSIAIDEKGAITLTDKFKSSVIMNGAGEVTIENKKDDKSQGKITMTAGGVITIDNKKDDESKNKIVFDATAETITLTAKDKSTILMDGKGKITLTADTNVIEMGVDTGKITINKTDVIIEKGAKVTILDALQISK